MIDGLPYVFDPSLAKWQPARCGVNSSGSQSVYGPFPPLPLPGSGDIQGEFHEVRFRTWVRSVPWQVEEIHVCRRFRLHELVEGSLTWQEVQ